MSDEKLQEIDERLAWPMNFYPAGQIREDVRWLREQLDAAKRERDELKQHLATQPTSIEEISFREALRSEVITITLKENQALHNQLVELRRAVAGTRDAMRQYMNQASKE